MGVLARLFGAEHDSDDDVVLRRYRHLLGTAPIESIEQAHAEAFGDRFPRGAILLLLVGIVVAMVVLAVLAPDMPIRVVIGLAVLSVAFGGIPSLLQSRMMHSVSARLRDIASAWVTISFNLAIGGGALLGGVLLDHLGIQVLPWAEAALVVVSIAFILITDRRRLSLHPDAHRG